jgi:Integrase core domain
MGQMAPMLFPGLPLSHDVSGIVLEVTGTGPARAYESQHHLLTHVRRRRFRYERPSMSRAKNGKGKSKVSVSEAASRVGKQVYHTGQGQDERTEASHPGPHAPWPLSGLDSAWSLASNPHRESGTRWRAAADVGQAAGRRETLCTVGGRNDSGTVWATPLEQGWVETYHKWLPFSLAKSQVVPFFAVTWPPNLMSSDTFKGISGPHSDEKLAPNIIDKYKRFLGSVRRECLDHFLIFHEKQLSRLLKAYVLYFNQARPHQGLGQQIPDPLVFSAPPSQPRNQVIAVPVLGRLHHDYQRTA